MKFVAHKPASRSAALVFAVGTGCLCVAGAFWQWVIVHWITPFLFPLFLASGLLLLLVSFGVAFSSLVRHVRRSHVLEVGPLVLNLCTVALLAFVPFTSLWLDFNYDWHRSARIRTVEQIKAGVLKPNVPYNPSLIRLPGSRTLSLGGNEVVVLPGGAQDGYVLFFTFRGILDHYSGFLYVPEGGSPDAFAEARGDHFVQVIPFEPHWFYVSAA